MKTIYQERILEFYLVVFLLLVGLNALVYKNIIDICYFVVAGMIIVKYVISSFRNR